MKIKEQILLDECLWKRMVEMLKEADIKEEEGIVDDIKRMIIKKYF